MNTHYTLTQWQKDYITISLYRPSRSPWSNGWFPLFSRFESVYYYTKKCSMEKPYDSNREMPLQSCPLWNAAWRLSPCIWSHILLHHCQTELFVFEFYYTAVHTVTPYYTTVCYITALLVVTPLSPLTGCAYATASYTRSHTSHYTYSTPPPLS